MYKVAVFVVMMAVVPSAHSASVNDLDFSNDLSSASFKKEVISAIEHELNKSQENILNDLCNKLILEHIQKFKWLSQSMSTNESVTTLNAKL